MKSEMNNNKANYWLVGFNFNNKDSQLERFFSENIWESRYNDNSNSDQQLLKLAKSIKKGDILILKSTATKGLNHNIPFLRVKGIGIVENDAKMLVICMSVSWVVLEWYLSHDFIVGNKSLSSCKSAYYVLYKCCFLLFSQVTYQYTFVIWLIVR